MTDRHVIEIRHGVHFGLPHWQAATVYAHCLCGWTGPRHVLQPQAADVAYQAATYDGDEHLLRPHTTPDAAVPRLRAGRRL